MYVLNEMLQQIGNKRKNKIFADFVFLHLNVASKRRKKKNE